MRWMEGLLERAGAGGALPTIQKLWGADRATGDTHAQDEFTPSRLHRGLNVFLALTALAASAGKPSCRIHRLSSGSP